MINFKITQLIKQKENFNFESTIKCVIFFPQKTIVYKSLDQYSQDQNPNIIKYSSSYISKKWRWSSNSQRYTCALIYQKKLVDVLERKLLQRSKHKIHLMCKLILKIQNHCIICGCHRSRVTLYKIFQYLTIDFILLDWVFAKYLSMSTVKSQIEN